MPRLTKIRISGCKYDGFRKFHENTIFDLTRDEEPDHTLFTLKNQGGKGVLLQLLSQVVMPETKWGKQNGNKITSLFYDQNSRFKPYTFHVVLEWKLDTVPEKWLITGICMSAHIKSSNEDEIEEQMGLNYFMYTYEHDSYNLFPLEGLPVYNGNIGRTADYKEFETFIDDNKKYIIKYSQTSSKRSDSDYYNYLRSKGIFRSEWEILKLINKVEGGVGEYFAKAGDNKSIFDKSIIPAIIENMKNYSDDDQGSLKDMFKSHLSITKNLPKLLEREGDYKNLIFSIEPVIHSTEIGMRREDLMDRCISDGDNLYAGANNLLNNYGKEISTWTEEKQKATNLHWELLYDKDNLNYVRLWRELKDKEKLESSLKVEEQGLKIIIDELDSEKLSFETSRLLLKRSVFESGKIEKEKEKQYLVESLNMKETEENIGFLDAMIRDNWLETDKSWKQISLGHNNYIESIQGEIDRFSAEKKRAQEQERQKSLKILQYDSQRAELDAVRLRLAETFGFMKMYVPEMLLEELQKTNIEEENNIEKFELTIDKYLLKKREHSDECIELKCSQGVAGNLLKDLSSRHDSARNLEETLRVRICSELNLDTDREVYRGIWIEKQRNQLEKTLTEKREKLDKLKQELWENNIDKQINHKKYWIPNLDIVSLRDSISELGITVQLGTEYLYELEEEEEKRGLLMAHPLIAYGVVISNEKDIQLIKNNLEEGFFSRNAVPIYIRSQMSVPQEGGFQVVLGLGFSLATSGAEYQHWFNLLQDKDAVLIEGIGIMDKKLEKLDKLIKDIGLRQSGESSELLFDLMELKRAEIEELDSKRNELLDKIAKLSELEKKDKVKLEEVAKKNKETLLQIQDMGRFIIQLRSLEVEGVEIQKERLEVEKLEIGIAQFYNEIEKHQKFIISDTLNYDRWKLRVEELLKEINTIIPEAGFEELDNKEGTFQILQSPQYMLIDETFRLCLSQRKAMTLELEQKNNGILLLNKEIEFAKLNIERVEGELNKVNKKWRICNCLQRSEAEHDIRIDEINKKLRLKNDYKDELHDALITIDVEIKGIEKNRKGAEKHMNEIYSRAPKLWEEMDLLQKEFQINESTQYNTEYLRKVEGILSQLEVQKAAIQEVIRDLRGFEELDSKRGKINDRLLEIIKENSSIAVEEWISRYKKIKRDLKVDEDKVSSDMDDYKKYVKDHVVDEILKSKILSTLQNIKLERYKNNLDSFISMKEHFLKEIGSIENDKARAEEVRIQWAQRAARHAITMVEALKSMISGMNYVNEKGHVFPLVKLKGDEVLPKEDKDVIHNLKEYFVESIGELLKDNEDVENIEDHKLERIMGDQAIFSRALSGRYPKLMVYKMTEKNEFRYNKPHEHYYTTWEAINKGEGDLTEGSGGQTLSVNTFVIMMLMNYQKKHVGNEKPWTVLILDNPFGRASGSHVLDPIFEIANKLNFQLIAFAAPEIIKVEISERFPVFWALKIADENDMLPGSMLGRVIHGGRIVK